ncbi:hypothetical protein CHUAL_013288 [Chamberlinius hualienensis]
MTKTPLVDFFKKTMSRHEYDIEAQDSQSTASLIHSNFKIKHVIFWVIIAVSAISIIVLTLALCGAIVYETKFISNFYNSDIPLPEINTTMVVSKRPTLQTVNVVAKNGSVVQLYCDLDEKPTKCLWQRRSALTEIVGRYQFLKRYESDCSIEIQQLKEFDMGEWKCSGLFENDVIVESQTIFLTVEHERVAVIDQVPTDQPLNAFEKTVELNSEVTLNCEFDNIGNCAWLRNNDHVEIEGRYSFTKSHNGGIKDCSITIKEVRDVDFGDWQCTSMADSDSNAKTLNTIKLRLANR